MSEHRSEAEGAATMSEVEATSRPEHRSEAEGAATTESGARGAPLPVLLVHGAWHGAWCWRKVADCLGARKVPVVVIDLPGHGDSPEPLGDLHADAASVRSALRQLDGPVILCGHSYGGAVITEAAAGTANVAHLVYLAALCPDVGESVMQLGSAVPETSDLANALVASVDGFSVTVRADAAADVFYGDCTAIDIADALGRLGPQPVDTLIQPVTGAPWHTVPSTYVVCTRDRAVPPSLQRYMAKRCSTVLEWDSSHSPFLSMPERVADLLTDLALAN